MVLKWRKNAYLFYHLVIFLSFLMLILKCWNVKFDEDILQFLPEKVLIKCICLSWHVYIMYCIAIIHMQSLTQIIYVYIVASIKLNLHSRQLKSHFKFSGMVTTSCAEIFSMWKNLSQPRTIITNRNHHLTSRGHWHSFYRSSKQSFCKYDIVVP